MFKSILSGYQAIIFDLDGTVLNNQHVWDNAIENILGKYIISDKPYWGIRGLPLIELIQDIKDNNDLSFDFDVDWAYSEINREYFKNFKDVEIRSGFEELAERLIKDEKRLVLASNSDREVVSQVLEKLPIKNFFEIILTRSDVKIGKPAPDIYLLAQKRLKVIPERILIFEDSPSGFFAAEAAKINSIVVLDSNMPAGEFGSNVKVFIRDFYDVLNLIDEDIEDYFAAHL